MRTAGRKLDGHFTVEPLEGRIAPAFSRVFNLIDLNGNNGFKATGDDSSDSIGLAVAAAGDVNGDGFDDVIVAAEYTTFVLFGKASGFTSGFDLTTLDGTNGFVITGIESDSQLSVDGAGDLNNDGFDDLIIGDHSASPNGSESGASYVIFGKATGFAVTIDVSALDGVNGFTINGGAAGNQLGSSVSGAGDLNGDGFDDVIVGAPGASPNGPSSGASFVIFGKASGFAADLEVSTLTGPNGFRIAGAASGDNLGISISGAGDVNGDGFDDVIVGSGGAGAYVVFGKGAATPFAASLTVSTLDGSNGFRLAGAANSYAGRAVSGLGDINGDGFDDIGVSSIGVYESSVSVVLGKVGGFAPSISLGNLSSPDGFHVVAPSKGGPNSLDVRAAGDVNKDGIDDFIVNSSLVFGRTAGFGDSLDVSTLDGVTGVTFVSPRPFDVIAGAGDFNKDGFADLVIGAPLNTSSGSAFVVLGQAAGNPSLSVSDAAVVEGDSGSTVLEFTVTLSSPSAQTVTVVYNSLNGSALAGYDYTAAVNQTLTFAPGETSQIITIQVAGDVVTEPDENLRIVLSNPANAQLKRPVAVGTIQNDDAPSEVDPSTLDGANGFFIDGAPYGATEVGDINGDGFGDIAVSGYNAYYGTNALYVVFGKAGGFGTNLDLGTIDGTNGFIVALDSYDGHTITSVQAAGDINGDGFDDLLIGDQFGGNDDYDSLRTYVVFGKGTPFGPSVDVGALDGTNGFTLAGQRQSYGFLNSDGAGDVNGDGFDDLILVDYYGRSNGATTGVAYVVFGKATGFLPEVDMEALIGANGFKVIGDYGPLSGGASIGDINGDGFGDVAVFSNYYAYGLGSRSVAYVIYGSASPFAPELSVTALNGNNGFSINSLATGIGDINGDGFDDLGVSRSVYVDEYTTEKHNYVLFGKASSFGVQTQVLNIYRSGIDGSNGFELLNGGFPVAAGDINGDGFDDLIAGKAVIFGSRAPFGATVDAQKLNGLNGFRVPIEPAEYNYGFITHLGDINGDGFDDIAGSGYYTGAFVVYGKPTGAPALSIGNSSHAEGNAGTAAFSFQVILSQASSSPVTVFYSTTDGSALAGSDFTGVSNQQLTFAPGETTKTIVIDVLGDTVVESAETFSVVLSNPTNAGLGTPTGVGTIMNDDSSGGGVTVSIGDASLAEGDSGQTAFVFPLTLSEPSAQAVTVLVSTSNGTATSGGDFAALLNQSVTFAAGETTKTVAVHVSGDTTIEANETFSVLLSAPTNATVGRGTGLGTILNDDVPAPIQLSIADAAVVEGNSGTAVLNFVVSLNTASSQAVTVLASTLNGTASDASDYTGITNTLIEFAPGETSKTFSVLVSGDTTEELNENLTVVLASPTNASVSRGAATGSIVNDDETIPDPQVLTFVEPDGDEITVELSGGTLDFGDLVFEGTPDGPVLAKIDLTGKAAELDGGTLTISVKSQGGDGSASIGLIDATGVNLKKVTIEGDVTSLIIGNSSSSSNAGKAPKAELAELFVQSFGQNASKFPSLTPSLKVPGGVGKFTVGGDFANIEAALGGGNGAGVKQLVVGGSIISSKFDVPGGIKSMKVKNMVDSTFNVGRQLQSLAVSGSITETTVSVNGPLKKMTVAGSITDSSIYAPGTTEAKNQKQSVALGSLSVGGSFVRSELLGGFDAGGAPVNPDASLGKISIAGGFDSSVIATGVKAGDDGFFGTDDDRLISASDNKVIAAIAAIQINGLVTGSVSDTDSFGIVAEEVKSVKMGKSNVSLRGGAANDLTRILLPGTTDVVVREVGV